MKSLIIYDSNYGTTKLIAETIGKTLNSNVIKVDDFKDDMLKDINLLIIGTPIIGWQPTKKIQDLLLAISQISPLKLKVATFDTRVKLFIHGDAMNKVLKKLQSAGGEPIITSMPFYVKGREGELLEGELSRAKSWASQIFDNWQTKG